MSQDYEANGRKKLRPTRVMSMEEFQARGMEPGILQRFKMLSPEDAVYLTREIQQFRRAENGDRVRPDLLPNGRGITPGKPLSNAEQYGFPTPYAPHDEHIPVRTEAELKGFRELDERIRAESTAEMLVDRMGSDADRPLDPPTLREQIAAAAAVHSEPMGGAE